MPVSRDIYRRIKSINNTKKITRAMELVSAAKMRKAVNNVLATRSYSDLAWQTVTNLAARTDKKLHPLLHQEKVGRVALVLVSSNRGLCSGFNTNITQKAIDFIKEQEKVKKVDIITLGKKGRDKILSQGSKIIAEFEKPDVTSEIADISALSHLLIKDYIEDKYDKVFLAYTDFISSLKQVPKVRQILPITKEDELLGKMGEDPSTPQQGSGQAGSPRPELGTKAGQGEDENEDKDEEELIFSEYDYIFEPSPDEVLEEILPRLIEMQIYQAVLESDASEHSARMMAMRNATEAAEDIITELTLAYNQARQAGITKEMVEISTSISAMAK